MSDLNKTQQLDKLVESGFISAEQKEGFEKLTQDELQHLIEQSEVVQSLEEEKTKAENERDEALAKLEVLESAKTSAPVAKPTPGLSFKFRSENYKFRDNAPKKIRYNNLILTQEELSKDEDALLDLIGGGSSLIQKL